MLPCLALSITLRVTAFTSVGLTAANISRRNACTLAAYGQPGPPGFPLANRPLPSLPFCVGFSGCSCCSSSMSLPHTLLDPLQHGDRHVEFAVDLRQLLIAVVLPRLDLGDPPLHVVDP